MKRNKMIIANDGETKVTIDVRIDDKGGLTRHELSVMSENIASGIMPVLATTQYLGVRLSQIRVR